eukprot:gene19729-24175_t
MVGVLAPVLLLGMRLMQGVCIGGEYTMSAVFLAENSPRRWRGLLRLPIQQRQSAPLAQRPMSWFWRKPPWHPPWTCSMTWVYRCWPAPPWVCKRARPVTAYSAPVPTPQAAAVTPPNASLAQLRAINRSAAFNQWCGIEVLSAQPGQAEIAMPWRAEAG